MIDSIAASEQTTSRGSAGTHEMGAWWILGLYTVAAASFLAGTRWAGWYGGNGFDSQLLVLPFVTVLGALTLVAAFWALRASEGLGAAMLGTWGSFWVAYGLLNALFAAGQLANPGDEFAELGLWFIVLGAITWMGSAAAMSGSAALVATLGFLAAASTVAAVANFAVSSGLMMMAGWLFVISAALGWYTASGMMLEATFGRPVLPLGQPTLPMTATSRRAAAASEPGMGLGQAPVSRRIG
jgi:uncharacterized protein